MIWHWTTAFSTIYIYTLGIYVYIRSIYIHKFKCTYACIHTLGEGKCICKYVCVWKDKQNKINKIESTSRELSFLKRYFWHLIKNNLAENFIEKLLLEFNYWSTTDMPLCKTALIWNSVECWTLEKTSVTSHVINPCW